MSRNLYKTLQREGTKRTDADMMKASAEFMICKFGARYCKTDKAIWHWHSLTETWGVLYGHRYNDIENTWTSLKEQLGDGAQITKNPKNSKKKQSKQQTKKYTIEIDGTKYKNQADACKRLDLSPGTVSGRIRNPNFPNWKELN